MSTKTQMINFSKEYDKQVVELVKLVNTGLLEQEEAALCLAGWLLKNSLNPPINKHETHEDLLKRCRVQIDTRLVNFDGLKAEHHF